LIQDPLLDVNDGCALKEQGDAAFEENDVFALKMRGDAAFQENVYADALALYTKVYSWARALFIGTPFIGMCRFRDLSLVWWLQFDRCISLVRPLWFFY
jgi:hypothetical protein